MKIQSDDLRSTLAERLADMVGHRILAAEFAPGAALREESLAAEYGVSRHLVREALRTLSAEGLVDYLAFKGARIPCLTVQQVKEIYAARRLLECGSLHEVGSDALARLVQLHGKFSSAVRRRAWRQATEIDAVFHIAIVACASSELALKWHRAAVRGLALANLVAPEFVGEDLNQSVAEHAIMLDLLQAGDAPGAAEALRTHLCNAETLLAVAVSQYELRSGEAQRVA